MVNQEDQKEGDAENGEQPDSPTKDNGHDQNSQEVSLDNTLEVALTRKVSQTNSDGGYRAVNRIKSKQEFIEVTPREPLQYYQENRFCVHVSNLPKDIVEKELGDFFNGLTDQAELKGIQGILLLQDTKALLRE